MTMHTRRWCLAIILIAMQVSSFACGDDPHVECDFPNESRCNEEGTAREVCVSINDSPDKVLVKYPCRVGTFCYETSPTQSDCLVPSAD